MRLDAKLRRENRRIVMIESGISGGVSVEIRPRISDGVFGYGHSEERFVRFECPPEWEPLYYAPEEVVRAVKQRALATATKYAQSIAPSVGEIRHWESGGIHGIPPSRWFEGAP